jgi:hypothetical protein
MHQLAENSDMTICIDNEALCVIFLDIGARFSEHWQMFVMDIRYDITTRALKVKVPTFDDLNGVSGYCISSDDPLVN